MSERQSGLGSDLFGTPMDGATNTAPATAAPPTADLDLIQQESESQALPSQEKQFRVAARVKSKLHNLPDPTRPPLGFTPGRGYDVMFPFIKLPHLAPNLNGDWVQFGSPEMEPNRLYYGDNLQVLRTLPSNSIDLIYIDPPFFSGADYNVIWGDTNEVRTFSDIWEGGLDTYLIWLNARLWEMRRVLKDTGSIYVHCDWHASHYIKTEMDRIFGYERFMNEVVWHYRSFHGNVKQYFPKKHDVLLAYTKSATWKFNRNFEPDNENTIDYKRWNNYLVDGSRITAGNMPMHDSRFVRFYDRWVRENGREPTGDDVVYEVSGQAFDDVWDVKPVDPKSSERLGYPTQKPSALLERIIRSSTDPGDVVADFFVGGGVGPAAAEMLGRRWIACDSSRVAVSVTLNRLVGVGETLSGVKSNYGKQGRLQATMSLPSPDAKVPDIRVHYVGVYPMDRFEAVEQPVFNEFILKCLGGQADASDSAITGWRSAREPMLVGPANPDSAPDPRAVQAFFDACVKKLEPNVKLSARVVAWRSSPDLLAYRKRLMDYVRKNIEPRGASMDLEFLLIDSEEFRDRIRSKYPDADESEFLLRFTKEPIVGEVRATRIAARKYRFEAADADSTNAGGYLVNCQWDFDYQRGHFSADSGYILGRKELKGAKAKAKGRKFEALVDAEYTFPVAGKKTVACRVQDNLGAETIRTVTIEVS